MKVPQNLTYSDWWAGEGRLSSGTPHPRPASARFKGALLLLGGLSARHNSRPRSCTFSFQGKTPRHGTSSPDTDTGNGLHLGRSPVVPGERARSEQHKPVPHPHPVSASGGGPPTLPASRPRYPCTPQGQVPPSPAGDLGAAPIPLSRAGRRHEAGQRRRQPPPSRTLGRPAGRPQRTWSGVTPQRSSAVLSSPHPELGP